MAQVGPFSKPPPPPKGASAKSSSRAGGAGGLNGFGDGQVPHFNEATIPPSDLIARSSMVRGLIHGLMRKHGLRNDWHDPARQEVRGRVVGTVFNNASGSHTSDRAIGLGEQEYVVILETMSRVVDDSNGRHHEEWDEIARFNLCDLFANLAVQIPSQCASCQGWVQVEDGRS